MSAHNWFNANEAKIAAWAILFPDSGIRESLGVKNATVAFLRIALPGWSTNLRCQILAGEFYLSPHSRLAIREEPATRQDEKRNSLRFWRSHCGGMERESEVPDSCTLRKAASHCTAGFYPATAMIV